MALPASGPITLNAVNVELGLAGTATISLNDAAVRTLFGIASGTITMSDGYGKSSSLGYIEDYFSTTLYDGIDGTQTIVTGVNTQQANALGGYLDGLIWIKQRTVSTDTSNGIYADMRHCLFQQQFGTGIGLSTNRTDGIGPLQMGNADITFNTDGFTIENAWNVNDAGATYVAWSFRPQQKFFTEAFYYGNGGAKTISHSLGSKPGCIIIKKTTYLSDWFVVSRKADNDYAVFSNNGTGLNQLAAANSSITGSAFTATTIDITALNNGSNNINVSGEGYIVYLFAHNAGGFGLTGTDNVISCGSWTGTGATPGPVVTLGYEPQWVIWKRTDAGTEEWHIRDVMRGMPVTASGQDLYANASRAAGNTVNEGLIPTATGFQVIGTNTNANTNGGNYIYIAIRRGPMEVPTLGTSVFAPLTTTGNGSSVRSFTGVGFPPDLVFPIMRASPGNHYLGDRLRGSGILKTTATDAEGSGYVKSYDQDGWTTQSDAFGNSFGYAFIDYLFRRAPGFFDVCCYTGTSSNPGVLNHNLGVVPELMIVKQRAPNTNYWAIYTAYTGNTKSLLLPSDEGAAVRSTWNNTSPTATTFTVENDSRVYSAGKTYVAYLFATCPGVSKVGGYTGTGALQTIDCGFSAGARFVLIKRTNYLTAGDWYIWDSARGITSGNDPYLLLNTTGAEVTSTNYVDTTSVGFQVTAAAPAALNASGGTYFFLAIA